MNLYTSALEQDNTSLYDYNKAMQEIWGGQGEATGI